MLFYYLEIILLSVATNLLSEIKCTFVFILSPYLSLTLNHSTSKLVFPPAWELLFT